MNIIPLSLKAFVIFVYKIELIVQGSVITFLDAHCECTEGWLEPLLAEIAKNRYSTYYIVQYSTPFLAKTGSGALYLKRWYIE